MKNKNDSENNNQQTEFVEELGKKILAKCKHRGKFDSPLCLREGILSGDCEYSYSYSHCKYYKPLINDPV